MNKERLEELREETAQYRAVADDRCMSTQYEDDILALIDAEIARQSVTDEAVQRALSELGFETSFELQSWWCKHGSLAITALRQMRTEPCQCTEICGICNNPNYHIHSGIWWKSASTEYGRENREIPTRHCPNCGRKLEG